MGDYFRGNYSSGRGHSGGNSSGAQNHPNSGQGTRSLHHYLYDNDDSGGRRVSIQSNVVQSAREQAHSRHAIDPSQSCHHIEFSNTAGSYANPTSYPRGSTSNYFDYENSHNKINNAYIYNKVAPPPPPPPVFNYPPHFNPNPPPYNGSSAYSDPPPYMAPNYQFPRAEPISRYLDYSIQKPATACHYNAEIKPALHQPRYSLAKRSHEGDDIGRTEDYSDPNSSDAHLTQTPCEQPYVTKPQVISLLDETEIIDLTSEEPLTIRDCGNGRNGIIAHESEVISPNPNSFPTTDSLHSLKAYFQRSFDTCINDEDRATMRQALLRKVDELSSNGKGLNEHIWENESIPIITSAPQCDNRSSAINCKNSSTDLIELHRKLLDFVWKSEGHCLDGAQGLSSFKKACNIIGKVKAGSICSVSRYPGQKGVLTWVSCAAVPGSGYYKAEMFEDPSSKIIYNADLHKKLYEFVRHWSDTPCLPDNLIYKFLQKHELKGEVDYKKVCNISGYSGQKGVLEWVDLIEILDDGSETRGFYRALQFLDYNSKLHSKFFDFVWECDNHKTQETASFVKANYFVGKIDPVKICATPPYSKQRGTLSWAFTEGNKNEYVYRASIFCEIIYNSDLYKKLLDYIKECNPIDFRIYEAEIENFKQLNGFRGAINYDRLFSIPPYEGQWGKITFGIDKGSKFFINVSKLELKISASLHSKLFDYIWESENHRLLIKGLDEFKQIHGIDHKLNHEKICNFPQYEGQRGSIELIKCHSKNASFQPYFRASIFENFVYNADLYNKILHFVWSMPDHRMYNSDLRRFMITNGLEGYLNHEKLRSIPANQKREGLLERVPSGRDENNKKISQGYYKAFKTLEYTSELHSKFFNFVWESVNHCISKRSADDWLFEQNICGKLKGNLLCSVPAYIGQRGRVEYIVESNGNNYFKATIFNNLSFIDLFPPTISEYLRANTIEPSQLSSSYILSLVKSAILAENVANEQATIELSATEKNSFDIKESGNRQLPITPTLLASHSSSESDAGANILLDESEPGSVYSSSPELAWLNEDITSFTREMDHNMDLHQKVRTRLVSKIEETLNSAILSSSLSLTTSNQSETNKNDKIHGINDNQNSKDLGDRKVGSKFRQPEDNSRNTSSGLSAPNSFRVALFGSSETTLALPCSDIDIVLVPSNKQLQPQNIQKDLAISGSKKKAKSETSSNKTEIGEEFNTNTNNMTCGNSKEVDSTAFEYECDSATALSYLSFAYSLLSSQSYLTKVQLITTANIPIIKAVAVASEILSSDEYQTGSLYNIPVDISINSFGHKGLDSTKFIMSLLGLDDINNSKYWFSDDINTNSYMIGESNVFPNSNKSSPDNNKLHKCGPLPQIEVMLSVVKLLRALLLTSFEVGNSSFSNWADKELPITFKDGKVIDHAAKDPIALGKSSNRRSIFRGLSQCIAALCCTPDNGSAGINQGSRRDLPQSSVPDSRLGKPFSGGLSTYATVLLVIAAHKQLLYNVYKNRRSRLTGSSSLSSSISYDFYTSNSESTVCCGQLLIETLELIGNRFQYTTDGINLINPAIHTSAFGQGNNQQLLNQNKLELNDSNSQSISNNHSNSISNISSYKANSESKILIPFNSDSIIYFPLKDSQIQSLRSASCWITDPVQPDLNITRSSFLFNQISLFAKSAVSVIKDMRDLLLHERRLKERLLGMGKKLRAPISKNNE